MQCLGIGPGVDVADEQKGFGAHADQERILESELYRFVHFQWDVVTDLAYPLPVVIICELLGVPPEDHATFSAWSSELAASIDPDPLISPDQRVRIW